MSRPGSHSRSAAQRHVRSVNYATSPLLAEKTPPWRSRFLLLLVALAFGGLLIRAADVQLVRNDFYQEEGEKRFAKSFEVGASRGRVLDRNGLVLATSVEASSVWAIPKDFEADARQRKQLANLLGLKAAELETRLDAHDNFAWLRRQVEPAVWAEVKALNLKGVHQTREFRRTYPEGEAAAQIVGFADTDEIGREGIELAFNQQLTGKPGSRSVVKDRLGRVVEDIGERLEPVHGQDVQLSIDSKVQFFAWQRIRDAIAEHGAKSGAVVVLDAQSGEILALASAPSFNPNDRLQAPPALRRNLALTDTFEPGSTMKPFIAAWAIESGRVKATTPVQTAPGQITITGSTIRDAHPHGVLSVAEVVQKSSNVGTVKLAMQMPPREMWELYARLGFGQKPQLDFPGVATGRLRAYKSWRPIEQATMSYGYGLSTSLVQLARAYTVFAREGELVPLSLQKQDGPVAGERIISPAVARQLREMLHAAASDGGTAPKAQRIAQGYSVGGKTGTARKQIGKEYATNKYRAWFVGLAPVNQPRIVVAVMVDEPSKGVFYGGDVAAPVFASVVQQTLRAMNVQPDVAVAPGIQASKPPVAEVESF
jgi:cell division protein FtsI (penicillin-binding protein 3)